MSLNRKIQPEFSVVEKLNMIQASEKRLDNNLPVYLIDASEQEVIKIDFIFDAGIWQQKEPLIASSANSLLNEGTKSFTSEQIAKTLDYYGAYIGLDTDRNHAVISLYTLNKYLDQTLNVIEEIIKYPSYPQNELDIYLQKRKQNFIIDFSKVETIARLRFNEAIFGSKHPYGAFSLAEDFDHVQRSSIVGFQQEWYGYENCYIIASGKVSGDLMKQLNERFGKQNWNKGNVLSRQDEQIQANANKKLYYEKADAQQNAIRIGKTTILRNHPDYSNLCVANTILGGYFGSRLMSNIREEKGYTYGIYSMLVPLRYSSIFLISSQVGSEVCEDAIREIKKEIEILRNELVDEEELSIVSNYMLGDMLRSFDGPFAMADRFKSIKESGLGYDHYERLFQTIKNSTPETVKNACSAYLSVDSMHEVVAGII